jgi:hypothetical protein
MDACNEVNNLGDLGNGRGALFLERHLSSGQRLCQFAGLHLKVEGGTGIKIPDTKGHSMRPGNAFPQYLVVFHLTSSPPALWNREETDKRTLAVQAHKEMATRILI